VASASWTAGVSIACTVAHAWNFLGSRSACAPKRKGQTRGRGLEIHVLLGGSRHLRQRRRTLLPEYRDGHVGYLRDDGLLVVTGRQETLVNVGGDKVNPEIVEEVLSSHPAIADCAVVNLPNELGIEEIHALIVTRAVFDEAELRKHCAERLQRVFIPVRFVAVERIPRNDMAKIERGQLMELMKVMAG